LAVPVSFLDKAGCLFNFAPRPRFYPYPIALLFFIMGYGMKHPGPDKCVVYHCDNKGGAERLQNTVELCFPHLSGKVPVLPMGAVTSCCCGTGAVAVSFADGIDQTKEQGCYGQRSKNA